MSSDDDKMTFGDHLEMLRQMLFRILGIVCELAVIIFCLKDITWDILLAPSECDFCTYRWIEDAAKIVGFSDFKFNDYNIDLITTDLSAQFMLHISTALYLGVLGASPFIMYELFRYISPALYDSEKKYSLHIAVIMYFLFIIGVLMTYFILFPISFRFLGTYQVSDKVHATITLDSYIETFTTLSLLMGVVFQLPVVAFVLGKLGFVSSSILATYRKHSFIIILLVSAIITPPDIMTLIIVALPLYMLYEVSIRVVKWTERT